jgi:hypothetical protein
LKSTNSTEYYNGTAWTAVDTGSSPLTTKGDLYGYSTTNARVPIGTNGQVLTADSTAALGLKWGTPASGSLTLITTQALSGVTSQSVNSCFSATYANYLLVFNAYCATSANTPTLKLRVSGTDASTNYYSSFLATKWTDGTNSSDYANNDTSWRARPLGQITTSSTNLGGTNLTLFNPFAAANTSYSGNYLDANTSGMNGYSGGVHNSATSYDGFTITNTTAMTGNVRVYGLAN